MYFCLERYGLFKASNSLDLNRVKLADGGQLNVVVAGFPDYAPHCTDFGEMLEELSIRPEDNHFVLTDLQNLLSLAPSSVDLLIAHRYFFAEMNDEQLKDFNQATNELLRPHGLAFAFYRGCLWQGKEDFFRALSQTLNYHHYRRWTFKNFRRLACPLKTVLEAEIEDENSKDRMALTLLAKQSSRWSEYDEDPILFDMPSYNRDRWTLRTDLPVLN